MACNVTGHSYAIFFWIHTMTYSPTPSENDKTVWYNIPHLINKVLMLCCWQYRPICSLVFRVHCLYKVKLHFLIFVFCEALWHMHMICSTFYTIDRDAKPLIPALQTKKLSHAGGLHLLVKPNKELIFRRYVLSSVSWLIFKMIWWIWWSYSWSYNICLLCFHFVL